MTWDWRLFNLALSFWLFTSGFQLGQDTQDQQCRAEQPTQNLLLCTLVCSVFVGIVVLYSFAKESLHLADICLYGHSRKREP